MRWIPARRSGRIARLARGEANGTSGRRKAQPMDQEQASPAHAEASHDVALGLEEHADEHESEEVAVSSSSGHTAQAAQAAPVDHAQLSTSVEGGHAGG